MSDLTYVMLENRGLIGLSGEDASDFLQGLISNDVRKVGAEKTIYAALLSPQGKFQYDFFLSHTADGLLIDCELDRLEDFMRKLSMYKLRARVELTDRTPELAVAALIGDDIATALGVENIEGATVSLAAGNACMDPRLIAMGGRAVLPRSDAAISLEKAGFKAGDMARYETLRLTHGLPDGCRDMIVDKAILLENGFVELHGIDWDKGCYMGQELTARTHYRGLVKKRLMPIRIDGPSPQPGSQIVADGKDVGEIRSVQDDRGLALIRLQPFRDKATFLAGEATILPDQPDWARFPDPE
ncbi:MAG TPA: folate-binding protein [Rhodospirillales bacterium]|nr:folate-binding protein [Rhodospirillales bacterium]